MRFAEKVMCLRLVVLCAEVCFMAVLVTLAAYGIALWWSERQEEWDAYAKAHHCQATHSDLLQTCWKCDAGPLGLEVCR